MILSNSVKAYALLVNARKKKILPWPWFTAVGVIVASHGFPPLLPTITIVAAMMTIATCVYLYNDVVDAEMDRLNPEKRDQPLTSGRVQKNEAMKVAAVNGLINL